VRILGSTDVRIVASTDVYTAVGYVLVPTDAFGAVGWVPVPTDAFGAVGWVPAPTDAFGTVGWVLVPTDAFGTVGWVQAPTDAFGTVGWVLVPTDAFARMVCVPASMEPCAVIVKYCESFFLIVSGLCGSAFSGRCHPRGLGRIEYRHPASFPWPAHAASVDAMAENPA
jgi:hypothetical protein